MNPITQKIGNWLPETRIASVIEIVFAILISLWNYTIEYYEIPLPVVDVSSLYAAPRSDASTSCQENDFVTGQIVYDLIDLDFPEDETEAGIPWVESGQDTDGRESPEIRAGKHAVRANECCEDTRNRDQKMQAEILFTIQQPHLFYTLQSSSDTCCEPGLCVPEDLVWCDHETLGMEESAGEDETLESHKNGPGNSVLERSSVESRFSLKPPRRKRKVNFCSDVTTFVYDREDEDDLTESSVEEQIISSDDSPPDAYDECI